MGKAADGRLIEIPFSEKYAAVNAVRALLTEPKPPVKKSELLAALHPLLEDDSMADLVIPDFARHKDWSVLDRVNNLVKKPSSNRAVKLGDQIHDSLA